MNRFQQGMFLGFLLSVLLVLTLALILDDDRRWLLNHRLRQLKRLVSEAGGKAQEAESEVSRQA